MPKLILRCNYLKNAPPSHLANYMNYISTREGVEKIDNTFGLLPAMVKQKELIADILSKIEDAERLGYDSATQWQALPRSRVELLCENYKIDSRNLKWYAAFHNESHHPHVHLVVFSTNPSEGYLSPKSIDTMRSTYAHDIFRQEFMSIYEKRTQHKEPLKEQANKSLLFLLQEMQSGSCHNEKIAEQGIYVWHTGDEAG